MTFEYQGEIYKSRRAFYLKNNPDREKATMNEVDRWFYHNVPEYRESKKTFYKQRYRDTKNTNVRSYIKVSKFSNDKN